MTDGVQGLLNRSAEERLLLVMFSCFGPPECA